MSTASLPSGIVAKRPWELAASGWSTIPVTPGYIDAHAHNLCVDDATEQVTRITATEKVMGSKVTWAALMGQMEGNPPSGMSALTTSTEINDLTAAALEMFHRTRFPGDTGYFIPFCFIPTEEFSSTSAAAEVSTRLGEGLKAVGELFVHAHHQDYAETDGYFLDVFRAAAAAGVPVSVHWDCGSVDPESDFTPEDNVEQFFEMLGKLGTEAPTIILCHCGAGPGMTDDEVDVWQSGLMERIFGDPAYDNVYFDLAGMQVVGSHKVVDNLLHSDTNVMRPAGGAIRDYIQQHPDRFLFGTDPTTGNSRSRRFSTLTPGHPKLMSTATSSTASGSPPTSNPSARTKRSCLSLTRPALLFPNPTRS